MNEKREARSENSEATDSVVVGTSPLASRLSMKALTPTQISI